MLDGRACTVLTPRPSQPERFATNAFHGTWHVLTDPAGAQLLARLMWAMAFQRKPRTILLVDSPLLVTNPFDADPSSPILIVNSDLGGPTRTGLDALEALLPLRAPSEGTVKLRIDGLARVADHRPAVAMGPRRRSTRAPAAQLDRPRAERACVRCRWVGAAQLGRGPSPNGRLRRSKPRGVGPRRGVPEPRGRGADLQRFHRARRRARNRSGASSTPVASTPSCSTWSARRCGRRSARRQARDERARARRAW